MTWQAKLALTYAREGGRTVARFEHDGPLRILQSMWPEGDAVCHNVLVHPPGGLVGGDTLDVRVAVGAGAHGLVTTPGAARFYRSESEAAVQNAVLKLRAGSRLEWMPMESIYYPGCLAHNRLEMDLDEQSELIGWDIAAFGLPHAGQPFAQGHVRQHLALQGHWLESAAIDARDSRLMDGPLGLAGRRCMGTMFFAAGESLPRPRRELALEAAREVLDASPLRESAGATSPSDRVVVVRVLGPVVEPVIESLKAIRRAWRPALWQCDASQPRGWSV